MFLAEKYRTVKVPGFVEFLIFMSVFWSSHIFFRQPFEFYPHYLVFLIFIPVFVLKFGYDRIIGIVLLYLLVLGMINIFLGIYAFFEFIRVWGGMLLSLSFYHLVIKFYRYNLKQIMAVYMNWSLILSMLGLLQIVGYRLGIGILYDYTWIFNKWKVTEGGIAGIRVNSIFAEPSTLAAVLGPAAFIAFYNLIHKRNFAIDKKYSFVIVLCYLLTSSSTAFIGVFITLFLISDAIKIRYFAIGAIVVAGSYYVLYNNSEDFKIRVDSSYDLWVNQDYSYDNINTSSFVLYNNFHVGLESLMEYPLIGTGLGSFETAFEKHSLTKDASIVNFDFEFNNKDGNSLLIRMMVEVGLIGIVFLFILLYRGFISGKNNEVDWTYRVISQAILIMIVLNLIRQGNYFLNAFPFFVLIYFENWRQWKRAVKEVEANEVKKLKPIGS